MTTLKEFETALREQGMNMALAILEKLKERDRANRTIRVGRRIAGKKMTPELARRIIELNQTTEMTQQEIAFQLGVNQGRVNEVLKHGKWLQDDPKSEEAVVARSGQGAHGKGSGRECSCEQAQELWLRRMRLHVARSRRPRNSAQLSIEDFLKQTMPSDEQ